MELRGAVAVLTGGSRGLGPWIAEALAEAGASVVLTARSGADLDRVAASLRARGARAVAVSGDVAHPPFQAELLRRAEAELGPVDVLVNNAGIEVTRPYHRIDPDETARVIDVNLTAPMRLTRLALPGMLERGRGHIVNIASLAGRAFPAYHEAYAASKAGLIGFTHSLRMEYAGTGVSASVVAPGFVRDAGMHHRGRSEAGIPTPRLVRTVTPEAVARAVVRAIQRDVPEILVAPLLTRAMIHALQPFPGLAARAMRALGVTGMYERAARADD